MKYYISMYKHNTSMKNMLNYIAYTSIDANI